MRVRVRVHECERVRARERVREHASVRAKDMCVGAIIDACARRLSYVFPGA